MSNLSKEQQTALNENLEKIQSMFPNGDMTQAKELLTKIAYGELPSVFAMANAWLAILGGKLDVVIPSYEGSRWEYGYAMVGAGAGSLNTLGAVYANSGYSIDDVLNNTTNAAVVAGGVEVGVLQVFFLDDALTPIGFYTGGGPGDSVFTAGVPKTHKWGH